MRSQPKLFISIIASIIITCGLIGFTVVRATQNNQPRVQEENRQYESSKKSQAPKKTDRAKTDKRIDQQATALAEDSSSKTDAMVYFSKSPDSESDPTAVYGVGRSIDSQSTPDAIVKQVIAGPTQEEKDSGFYGGIELNGASMCAGQDFKISVDDSVATLQFCRDHVSGGKAEDAREQSQLLNSLKQLPGVTGVVILNQKSGCLFGASNTGTCTVQN